MLNLQPTLTGRQVLLRPLASTDFEPLQVVASDPFIWSQHPDPARSTRGGFEPFFAQAMRSGGSLVAVDRQRQCVIGCTRYHSYLPAERVTIGYTFLSRDYWGGATNGEMKRLMLQHAFTDVREVLFLVTEQNLRSRRAVEKLGAQHVAAEDAPRFGQIHFIYQLTAARWREVKTLLPPQGAQVAG